LPPPPFCPLDPLLAALLPELPLLGAVCEPEPPEVEPPLPEFELPHAAPNPAIKRAGNAKCGRAVI
jgi:hypothetical protein